MIKPEKQQVITFKADVELVEAIEHIPNRSKFIREAILAALDNTCPLCGGSGQLTPHQKGHWVRFSRDHSIQQCPDCSERYLVCDRPGHRQRPVR